MLPLLLNKIIQTDKLLFLHLVTQKNRIYTFLNPVSYLIALENKSLYDLPCSRIVELSHGKP